MKNTCISGLNAPLSDAVLRGDAVSVRALLAAGADADSRLYDVPMLILAVLRDDVPTARALLEGGASVLAESLASRRERGFMLDVQLSQLGRSLRSRGIDTDASGWFFHARAVRFASSAAMLRLLRQHGARIDGELNVCLASGEAPLELVEAFLEGEGDADAAGVAFHPAHGPALARAVLQAAERGRAGLLERLLRAGGKADQMLVGRRTPLHLAATPEVVRVLLAHGASLNAADCRGITPLGAAGNAAVADELRAQGARRLHLRPVCLPELHEAVRLNDFDRVRRLLSAGADVNACSEYGSTPLFHATGVQMTRLLLGCGADVRARDEFGSSALSFARKGEPLRLLLAALGLPEDTARPPLPPLAPRYELVTNPRAAVLPPCGVIPCSLSAACPQADLPHAEG